MSGSQRTALVLACPLFFNTSWLSGYVLWIVIMGASLLWVRIQPIQQEKSPNDTDCLNDVKPRENKYLGFIYLFWYKILNIFYLIFLCSCWFYETTSTLKHIIFLSEECSSVNMYNFVRSDGRSIGRSVNRWDLQHNCAKTGFNLNKILCITWTIFFPKIVLKR